MIFNGQNGILTTLGQSRSISYNEGLNQKLHYLGGVDWANSNLYDINNHLTFRTCSSKSNPNHTNGKISCSSSIVSSTAIFFIEFHCAILKSDTWESQLETTVEQLNQDLDLGQTLEVNTKNMSLTFEKVSLNNISGKRLIQSSGTEIRFPSLDLNQTATISVSFNLSFICL